MNDERQDFSRRLMEAMQARGYDPKPGVLWKLFNSRYKGHSIAFSSASKWLRGMSLPEQDKLQVLAELFRVEPHELRYGKRPRTDELLTAALAPDLRESQAIASFLALSPKRRDLVMALIAELAHPAGGQQVGGE